MILPKSKWPKYLLKFKELKGIFYCGCVCGLSHTVDCSAHAHDTLNQKGAGWICLTYKSRVRNRLLMLHEVAHLIVGAKKYSRDHNHDDVWRRQLLKIGGSLDPFPTSKNRETISYKKGKRREKHD